ncbi:MAG: hydrogenase maturation protease [Woeseiaceae bacterium]|nr:hydrogenase maturation protease [Woeseiaceae bacterium]
MNATEPALVVLAWGNESRADDGVGPLLAHRILALRRPQVTVIEDLQLHIEHVMDLVPDVPALFIDASVGIEEGFSIERIAPVADHSVTTHSISPQALLQLYETTLKQPAPVAFLLQVAGRNFELGETISDATMRAAEAAWAFLEEMLSLPPGRWQAALESPFGQAAIK